MAKEIRLINPIPQYKKPGLNIIALNFDKAFTYSMYKITGMEHDTRNAKTRLYWYPVDVEDDGRLVNSESEAIRGTQVYESVLMTCIDIIGKGSWSPGYALAFILPPTPDRLKEGILNNPRIGNAFVQKTVERNTLRTMLLVQEKQRLQVLEQLKLTDPTQVFAKLAEIKKYLEREMKDGSNAPPPGY